MNSENLSTLLLEGINLIFEKWYYIIIYIKKVI